LVAIIAHAPYRMTYFYGNNSATGARGVQGCSPGGVWGEASRSWHLLKTA